MSAIDLLLAALALALVGGALGWGWRRDRLRLEKSRARLRESERLRADLLRQNAELRQRLTAATTRPTAAAAPAPAETQIPAAAATAAPPVVRVTQVSIPKGIDTIDEDAPAYWEETRPVLPSDEAPAFASTQPNLLARRTRA